MAQITLSATVQPQQMGQRLDQTLAGIVPRLLPLPFEDVDRRRLGAGQWCRAKCAAYQSLRR